MTAASELSGEIDSWTELDPCAGREKRVPANDAALQRLTPQRLAVAHPRAGPNAYIKDAES